MDVIDRLYHIWITEGTKVRVDRSLRLDMQHSPVISDYAARLVYTVELLESGKYCAVCMRPMNKTTPSCPVHGPVNSWQPIFSERGTDLEQICISLERKITGRIEYRLKAQHANA